ncbi:pilus assembly protein [Massilia soli]|uniref:Pilus assembly protein n=1 Tax=Massilia soli TaxID=2792854 RepID=A0ABS7SRI4_9BURK|nr:pilus assembly protein [Massilia soli]MBZ2208550.1 pilus assembly protein [Massilia soli]
MTLKRVLRLSACSATMLAASCALPPNAQPDPLGATVSLTMAQQVINPAAGANPDPVAGIDGKAAKGGYDAYQKSFRAPVPQPNVFTIGVAGNR